MVYKIVLFRSAVIDFQGAEDWYLQRSAAKAKQFVKVYLKLIQSIETAPLQYPAIYKEVRMARFGKAFALYSILFFLQDDTAYIVSIFHDNRSEKVWQGRL